MSILRIVSRLCISVILTERTIKIINCKKLKLFCVTWTNSRPRSNRGQFTGHRWETPWLGSVEPNYTEWRLFCFGYTYHLFRLLVSVERWRIFGVITIPTPVCLYVPSLLSLLPRRSPWWTWNIGVGGGGLWTLVKKSKTIIFYYIGFS